MKTDHKDSENSLDFGRNLSKFCVLDVGSTTTKAILFRREPDWRFYRREVPTTVEKPFEDVTFGVINVLRELEKCSGEVILEDGIPRLPCFSTSSAGGGLAVVVAGLVQEVTARSAERVALGAGALIQDVIALDDGRPPYMKIETLKSLHPDMLLLAGGFDGGAVSGPVFLAEMIFQSNLRPKLTRGGKLPVIYAGNIDARKYAREILGERFILCEVPNIRPSGRKENLEPARNAIHDVFMDHVMSRAPGYEKYKKWISATILPTPAAVGRLLALASKDLDAKILAVDIGGATTDVFTAQNGYVFRTVSANLGMSYSILNVVKQAGLDAVSELLDFNIERVELLDRIGNKYLRPTELPGSVEDVKIECAVASAAIREAVKEHCRVMRGVALSRTEEDLGWSYLKGKSKSKKTGEGCIPGLDHDFIIGSGGILSHSPRETAAMILLSSLQPEGLVKLGVDSVFMFPHLGVLSQVNQELALELFYRFGLVRLGMLVAPGGRVKPGGEVTLIETVSDSLRGMQQTIKAGAVRLIHYDQTGKTGFRIRTKKLKLKQKEVKIDGDSSLLIIDTRGRPAEGKVDFRLGPDCIPAPRAADTANGEKVYEGEIRIARELAIPGEVFVKPGDEVSPHTIVARSTQSFLRPFFLDVARSINVSPDEMPEFLKKKIGDDILAGEILAENRANPLSPKEYKPNVSGTIEKILPNGIVVVREKQEFARDLQTINVVKELGIKPEKLDLYLRCKAGQEVEKGQILAGKHPVHTRPSGRLAGCRSPVRGKIKEINRKYGLIIVGPLSEELELNAWIPGKVDGVTERGCVIRNRGTIIAGVWGNGGQSFGRLSFDEIGSESISVHDFADRDHLVQIKSRGGRGLISAGLHLKDFYEIRPDYPVVIIEGFSRKTFDTGIKKILQSNEGRFAAIDATTQLRAGVRRPQIIIPES
jgi:uncharacterized protein (TIGR01319 family)